jgi:hypothetical protein
VSSVPLIFLFDRLGKLITELNLLNQRTYEENEELGEDLADQGALDGGSTQLKYGVPDEGVVVNSLPEGDPDLQEHPVSEPKGPFVPPITRTRRNGPGNCSVYEDELGTQDINFVVGRKAHIQIQMYFVSRFGASAEVEYPIPGSGVGGGVGAADAVLLDEGIRWGSLPDNNYAGIYEIKPGSQVKNPTAAQAQRDRYINNFHNSERGGTAVAGTIWRPKDVIVGPWEFDPSQELVITLTKSH